MRIQCPKCGKGGKANDSLAGKKIRCPACKEVFVAAKVEEEVPTFTSDVDPAPPPVLTKPPVFPKAETPQRANLSHRRLAPNEHPMQPATIVKEASSAMTKGRILGIILGIVGIVLLVPQVNLLDNRMPQLAVGFILLVLGILGIWLLKPGKSLAFSVNDSNPVTKMSDVATQTFSDTSPKDLASNSRKTSLVHMVIGIIVIAVPVYFAYTTIFSSHRDSSISSGAPGPLAYQWKLSEFADILKEKLKSPPSVKAGAMVDLADGAVSEGVQRNLFGLVGDGRVIIKILLYGKENLEKISVEISVITGKGRDPSAGAERLQRAAFVDTCVSAMFVAKAAKMDQQGTYHYKSALALVTWISASLQSMQFFGNPEYKEEKQVGPFYVSKSSKYDAITGIHLVKTLMEYR